ncbi:uncharacterized protein TNCT_438291 [Trichonephila clavata]|uniref:Uncharacterized protein n=1 Tax=Trichonephila clavata TaxID=2740835 RepID=A0A8X6HLU1_TRICU|nr:uncharacterized protein TNCT_438291 [Trichonephila clavata]
MEKALSQVKFITAIITSRDTLFLFTFCFHQSQIQLNCLCVNIDMPPKSVPFKLATCKCKYRCHDLVENEVRKLHTDFWKQREDGQVRLEKLKLIAKRELHLRNAEKAVNLLNEDNASSRMPSTGTCTINMDMQQMIFTPTLTHSSMFYSRQLSNLNLCIHNGDTSTSFMCLWHEGMAGRGGNDVASCLLKVITSNLTPK